MNPLHFQQRPLNQQRQTTASSGWKNGSATGATSAFNGYPLKTRSVAVLLPLGDFGGMEHLWFWLVPSEIEPFLCSRRPTMLWGASLERTGEYWESRGIMLLYLYTLYLTLMWPVWWRCLRSTFGAIAMRVICNLLFGVHCVQADASIIAHRWRPCVTMNSFQSGPTVIPKWATLPIMPSNECWWATGSIKRNHSVDLHDTIPLHSLFHVGLLTLRDPVPHSTSLWSACDSRLLHFCGLICAV